MAVVLVCSKTIVKPDPATPFRPIKQLTKGFKMAIMIKIITFGRLIMQSIAAKEAKTHFGELIDKAQREPVSIEKYGRPVAVIMSSEEYKQIKLERLRARLAIGEVQLDRSEGIDGRTFFKELREGKR